MTIQSLTLMLGRFRRKLPAYIASSKIPKSFPLQGPRVIITLAADYPNLGDVALTQSVFEFCRLHLPSHKIFVIPAHQTLRFLKGTALHAEADDVVVIVGGGNMGDRYRRLEEWRCVIIESFPRQRIISFPQSCEFKSPLAEDYSRTVYAAHQQLTLCARDSASWERMRKAFPETSVIRVPDTALLLTPASPSTKLVPVVCLRTDSESRLGADRRAKLIEGLKNFWPQTVSTDTAAQQTIENYPAELQALFGVFSQASVVVTDRLHGLIFAKLHQKPCVVIEGDNDKLKAFVNTWMPDAKNICIVDNPTAETVYQAVEHVTRAPVSPAISSDLFQPLVLALKGEKIPGIKV
jgi:pyruvyl transferase EpsI